MFDSCIFWTEPDISEKGIFQSHVTYDVTTRVVRQRPQETTSQLYWSPTRLRSVLQSATMGYYTVRLVLQSATNVITKSDRYYKVHRFHKVRQYWDTSIDALVHSHAKVRSVFDKVFRSLECNQFRSFCWCIEKILKRLFRIQGSRKTILRHHKRIKLHGADVDRNTGSFFIHRRNARTLHAFYKEMAVTLSSQHPYDKILTFLINVKRDQ